MLRSTKSTSPIEGEYLEKPGEDTRLRTTSGIGLVEVGKLAQEIGRIVGFDEVIRIDPEGHCT